MKKNVFIIYIMMIIIGIIGLFFIMNQPEPQNIEPQQIVIDDSKKIVTDKILVAVAKRDLEKATILAENDYVTKVIEVERDNGDKEKYNISDPAVIISSALLHPVEKGSYIPINYFTKPGSTEYISMFLEPGKYIYTLHIDHNDSYLFYNLKIGDYIDIYMEINKSKEDDGDMKINYQQNDNAATALSSNNKNQLVRLEFRPLLKKKRVLATIGYDNDNNSQELTEQTRDSVNKVVTGDIYIELNEDELKLIKALTNKTKLHLFPSSDKNEKIIDEEIKVFDSSDSIREIRGSEKK